MINLNSNIAKQRARIYIERQMQVVEKDFITEILNVLKSQFKLSAQLIAMGSRDYNHAVNEKEKYLRKYLYDSYKKIYVVFGEIIFKSLEDAGLIQKSIMDYEKKTIKNEYEITMDIWAQIEAAKKIYGLNKTTKNIIAKIIKRGLDEGNSNLEIAEKIMQTSNKINLARALKIAKTETHSAAMKSMNTAMSTTRLKYKKEWITAGDGRVRTLYKGKGFSHVAASGETVDQNDFYTKTGEALFYPGDVNGSSGNIIHCRCIETYKVVSNLYKNYIGHIRRVA